MACHNGVDGPIITTTIWYGGLMMIGTSSLPDGMLG